MGSNEITVKSEAFAAALWPLSATLTSEDFSKVPHETNVPLSATEDCSLLPTWNSSTMSLQPLQENINCQPYLGQKQYFIDTDFSEDKSLLSNGNQKSLGCSADYSLMGWQTKTFDDRSELNNYDSDMSLGMAIQEYTTNMSSPGINMRYSEHAIDTGHCNSKQLNDNRRMSSSSFTMSTTGPLLEMQSYEDFSTTASESTSFTSSEYLPQSNRNSWMSSSQLSPVASPRMTPQHRSEFFWPQSQNRSNPSPRASLRSAPYYMDCDRSKRWSTGSYALSTNRRLFPFILQQNQELPNSNPNQISSRHSSPTLPETQQPLSISNFDQTQPQSLFIPEDVNSHHESALIPSHNYDEPAQFENKASICSHGLFRMLQSNTDMHSLHTHFNDFCERPDLYASLYEEHMAPPPEDMNPSNPELIPHEQELRFEGDLYTPRWVRGHGNKREGWCGICKPGRWLILKNSAFWYDKSFTHGISAATGSAFREPQETRRMDGNPDIWEGLCSSCNEWVALVSSKKKGTTWFRHAYKCHTHLKIKDAPKRRRESLNIRAVSASKSVKPKIESPQSQQNIRFSTNTFSNGML
ncbi:Meiotic expression up-regulated protein 26 [Erysiphe necator]|nr:Meiotic expression up-regulated protein 26 [Erysiphe necator]